MNLQNYYGFILSAEHFQHFFYNKYLQDIQSEKQKNNLVVMQGANHKNITKMLQIEVKVDLIFFQTM